LQRSSETARIIGDEPRRQEDNDQTMPGSRRSGRSIDCHPRPINQSRRLRPAQAMYAFLSRLFTTKTPGVPAHDTSNKELRDTAQQTYRANRWYHGTSHESRRHIEKNGFRREDKVDGAASRYARTHLTPSQRADPRQARQLEQFLKASQEHHFVTDDRKTAATYARFASARHWPASRAIVRILGTSDELGLHTDPNSTERPCWRTSQDIGPEHILGSHGKPNDRAVERFRGLLEGRFDRPVSHEEAQAWLQEVQSNSDDDL
jgi:hypothetical protein